MEPEESDSGLNSYDVVSSLACNDDTRLKHTIFVFARVQDAEDAYEQEVLEPEESDSGLNNYDVVSS